MSSEDLNLKIHKLIQITSQENILLKSFENFYENSDNINNFLSIINSNLIFNSNISIRLIDYFVTKYSKKYKIFYKINENNINAPFYVYQSYKQQLKLYQKKFFDPFARGVRIPYFLHDTCLITTIGQLNFFRWFISKNILDYVINNKYAIELDMNKNKKKKSEPKIIKPNNKHKQNTKINKIVTTPKTTSKITNNILVTF